MPTRKASAVLHGRIDPAHHANEAERGQLPSSTGVGPLMNGSIVRASPPTGRHSNRAVHRAAPNVTKASPPIVCSGPIDRPVHEVRRRHGERDAETGRQETESRAVVAEDHVAYSAARRS